MAEKLIAQNKKAFHDYHVEETFEAGIVLVGTEVKSLRAGKANFRDSFVLIRDGEAWLNNLHIPPYDFGNRTNHDPDRVRKLLLHRREIDRLGGKVRERGYTLVPLRLYFKNGRVKVEIGLVRGKKQYDKREDLKKRETNRELAAIVKQRHRTGSGA